MKNEKEEHYLFKTIKYDNMTVNVYCPIISKEENERRYKKIHDAAVELLKEKIRKSRA